MRTSKVAGLALGMLLISPSVHAGSLPDTEPLYPVEVVLEDVQRETVYPSVAGDFVVYSQRVNHEYNVVRVHRGDVAAQGRAVKPDYPKEMIRYGVAIEDGAIGHISSRMGPLSAWMLQAGGDVYTAIGNLDAFDGGLLPNHLNASADGKIWCYDTSLQKTRRARLLSEFIDGVQDVELLGQSWRMYNSDAWRYKQGYQATKTGARNKFEAPSLFVFYRQSRDLMMIPHAFSGSISNDGKRIAFVREHDGNYDIWMQDLDGKNLKQITHNTYGDFEPAFSPDGKQLAFISNRDAKGEVLRTSIYVMDLATAVITRVTNAPRATDGGVAWLDQTHLIFHSNRDPKQPQDRAGGHWNLWKVSLKP